VLRGVLILASPLLLGFLAFKARAGMPVRVALLWAILGVYALWAADLLFFPLLIDSRIRASDPYVTGSLGRWINAVPFATISAQLHALSASAIRQLGGNLGLLLPLGLIGPIVMPSLRRARRLTLVALCASASIELVQLLGTSLRFVDRSVDVDDVILNVAGALLGWLLWRILVRRFVRSRPSGPVS
jgi:glycopeptide antibiotics resistance protein